LALCQAFSITLQIMDKNEIKKYLYKDNPKAYLWQVRKDGIYYIAKQGKESITFLVPLSEIGEATWYNTMEAKLLIRYLQ
jgi:hypothetical protein